MSQDTETEGREAVADTDISPHEETNLLERVRRGELDVPPHMMGYRIYSPSNTHQTAIPLSQGGLSLRELQEKSAARQAKEAAEAARNKEAKKLRDFLKLGEKVHNKKCPPNPFLSGDGLGDLTTSLGKSVSIIPEDIWSAICCLESYDANILSFQFQFELPRGKKSVYYSPRGLSKALAELKYNLKALSAYRGQQGQGDDTSLSKAEESDQTSFVLTGKPFTSCFKLIGLPRSQGRVFHLIKWEKPNLLPVHCKNGYFAKITFQHNLSKLLSPRILRRIAEGSALPLPKETLPSFYLVGNPYVSFFPEYFRLVGQPTTPAAPEMHYLRIIPPSPAVLFRIEKIAFPEEKPPMTANNDPEIPANLVVFLETVGSADLTSEEAVRGLLCQISLEALKRDLGFEMSIDQLVPFCLVNHLDSSFTISQARNFFIFFGKGESSVARIATHLKDTTVANVFAQKKAAVRKLQKFAHARLGTEKLVTISQLLRNSALVQKLRALDIHETEDLLKLTGTELIGLISVNEGNNFLSVRAIAKNLDRHGLHLADGPEATRHLFKYHPQTYKPIIKPAGPGASPPAAARAKSEVQIPATADSPADDPVPVPLETALQKIGAAWDKLKKEIPTLSHLSISANFKDANGKGQRIAINDMNLSPLE